MINKNQPKPKQNINNDSFLESLRSLGADITNTSKNAVSDGKDDILNSIFSFRNNQASNQPGSENKIVNQKEAGFNKVQPENREYLTKNETLLFSREQIEIKRQVVTLQSEILQLAKSTGELASQVQITSMENIPQTGNYHKNFFEMLIKYIRKLTAEVRESSFWLTSWNKKSQKRNFYWGQAKKSGSSFMLHHDRSVATQTG